MQKIDFNSFSQAGQASSTATPDRRWWLANKTDRAAAIQSVVKAIAEYDSKRQTQYQIATRLYGNTNLMGLNGLSFSKLASTQAANKDRVSYNVVQSAIDTITAKISKNRPRPLFLTSGGDHKVQRKAKKLDQFVDGVFYENDAYALGSHIFRDGCVLGDGFIHVFDHYGRVKYERVLPHELYTDWVEAFYGNPRQLHRVKVIDRAVLIDQFPEKKRLIMDVNSASADLLGAYQNVADQVVVTESWHLPSGPDATDGLHAITVDNGTLFEEEYKKDFFPFAQFSWSKRMHGYWGQGLSEQIQNIQYEINKILWVIQRSMHLAGSFKVFLANGSKVVKEHLNNDIGAIISYTGQEPKYVVPPIVPMELYQHLQTLKTSAFEQAGVSQLSANSQKPAGLNSGKALREYNDIESERFMTVGQAYERFYLELSKISISVAKDIYSRDNKYQVKVPGKKFIKTIDWKDIDLEEDEYVMKVFPVSSLPTDPEGRLQTIQEYMQAGIIDPVTGRRLLDFPDLDQIESLANAQEDWILEILEKIVDDGEYSSPEPEMDLKTARLFALQFYAQGMVNKLEEDKLELLRRFMKQISTIEQAAQPPAPPMGAPPAGAPPMAGPMPTPQSELLPNVPQAGAA